MTSITLKTARAGILCVLGAIVAVLLCSNALFAQANFGRILGTVTDQTGAVLPGAVVTVVDTERGVAISFTVLVKPGWARGGPMSTSSTARIGIGRTMSPTSEASTPSSLA
jgi:hypothetical protein